MKVRLVALSAVLALAAGLLSSCRTNVGVAARVDGHRISENSVSDYVLTSGPRASASAGASSSSQPAAKPLVVRYLVQRAVLRSVLSQKGGVPSETQLARIRSQAEVQVAGAARTGAEFEKSLYPQLDQIGIKRSFVTPYLEVIELLYTYVQREKLRSLTGLAASIAKLVSVRVNPRYGKWVPAQFTLDVAGGTPGYLNLQSTIAPARG